MVYDIVKVACGNKDHLDYWNSAIRQSSICGENEFDWKKFSTILEITSDSMFKCACLYFNILRKALSYGQVEVFEILCKRGLDLHAKIYKYGYLILLDYDPMF